MTTLKEIVDYLKGYLEPVYRDDYCPNGLQVEGKEKVEKGAFAVSASVHVIEEAIKWDADFLFVHHGLFWKGDPYPLVGTKRKKVKLLLEHDLSLIAYHLPLDAHEEVGNNWKAAKDLGWGDLAPFQDIGVRGTFKSCSAEAFKEKLERYYGRKAEAVLGGKEEISSAALVSGGAYKLIPQAKGAGVDAYISGNVDEPAYHLAMEEGVNFFSLGHDATEKVGPKALAEHIKERFGIKTLFIGENNPF